MNTIFQVLTLAYTLQGGQYFTNALLDSDTFTVNNNYFVETSFELQVPFSWQKGGKDQLYSGASTENQFLKSDSFWGFTPWQDTYKFFAGVRFLGIEIGFDHMCLHPVESVNFKRSQVFASYDKVHIVISGSF